MNNKLPISATILVKNSARYLSAVLTSLKHFDEIVVLDNGSSDDSLAIAQQFDNVLLVQCEFNGFGALKNHASQVARNDWIFNIDSDEIPDEKLLSALASADLSNTKKVYTVSRLNHYRERPIKACGWYPDVVPRLYNRTHTQFSPSAVHEKIMTQNCQVRRLDGVLNHYTYDSVEHLIAKMQHYSTLFAQHNRFHKHTSPLQACLHGAWAFFRSYFLRRGFLYGADGLVICATTGAGSFYKYAKLHELNQSLSVSILIDADEDVPSDSLTQTVHSILRQSRLPTEILVLDSSNKINEPWLNTIKPNTVSIRILPHATLPEIINEIKGQYIIILNNHTTLNRHFVRQHIKIAQKGVWIKGAIVAESKRKFGRFGGVFSPLFSNGFNNVAMFKEDFLMLAPCPSLNELKRQNISWKKSRFAGVAYD